MKTRFNAIDSICCGRTLVVLTLSLIVSGCGGGGGTSTGITPTGPVVAQQSSVTEPDRLTFSVSEDKATAAVGEPVTLHITLTNNTSAPITGTFATDSFGFTTLDPLLFKSSIVQDAEANYISTTGSIDSPATKFNRVDVTVAPGQSFASTLIYTFTRPDTYKVMSGLANLAYPDYVSPSYPKAGPLTIIVHS